MSSLCFTGRDIVLEDGETPSSNAVVTIQSLLDLRDKYDQFLAGPFNKDQQFTDTIDQVRLLCHYGNKEGIL